MHPDERSQEGENNDSNATDSEKQAGESVAESGSAPGIDGVHAPSKQTAPKTQAQNLRKHLTEKVVILATRVQWVASLARPDIEVTTLILAVGTIFLAIVGVFQWQALKSANRLAGEVAKDAEKSFDATLKVAQSSLRTSQLIGAPYIAIIFPPVPKITQDMLPRLFYTNESATPALQAQMCSPVYFATDGISEELVTKLMQSPDCHYK